MISLLYGPPLPVGAPAPDFTLSAADGRAVTLSALRGRNVVLVFYPKDETPVCRQQLCDFRDQFATATAHNAVVFGINPGDAKSHQGFSGKLTLPFPLLVDKGSEVASLYKAKGLLWTVRTVYGIGTDGRIRFSRRGKPDPQQVFAAL